MFKNHRKRRQACETAGKNISEVPFPAVVYRINHTISLQFEKKGFKTVQKERLIPVTQCSGYFMNLVWIIIRFLLAYVTQ